MVSTFSLPRLSEDQITAVVRAGYYSSKSDVIKDALRLLFKSRKNLRHASAIELLKEGRISLGKAAELAEVSVEELNRMLEHHKIYREVRVDKSELDRISETK